MEKASHQVQNVEQGDVRPAEHAGQYGAERKQEGGREA